MDFLALAKESMAVNDQLVSWAAHMLLVWLLGLSLGWLVSTQPCVTGSQEFRHLRSRWCG